jgi:hypothetical protein
MKLGATHYPTLQLFNRIYQFESQTDGTYNADQKTRQRITWDYWNKSHLWNLADPRVVSSRESFAGRD